MRQTEHYNLALPGQDDFYDIEVFNQNAQRIDRVLREMSFAISNQQKKLALTFLESDTFHPADYGLAGKEVDVYMVGGGGGGNFDAMAGAGGGGGGYCKLLRNIHLDQSSYQIVIGAGGAARQTGGTTLAFGESAPGGMGMAMMINWGGNGGSGGGSTGGSGGAFGGGGAGTATGGHRGGLGGGNVNFTPVNPYDNIAYGSGGGGSPAGAGGGSGGAANGDVMHAAGLGGGGGSNSRGGVAAGDGGRGGGGGGGALSSQAATGGGRGGAGIVYIYATPTIPNLGPTEPESAAFFGELTPAEIMAFDAICTARDIHVGIIKDGICQDVAIFRDIETASAFLESGTWPRADSVVILPEGYGIGDSFNGEDWASSPGAEAK